MSDLRAASAPWGRGIRLAGALLSVFVLLAPLGAGADDTDDDLVRLDFQNAELTAVIDTIAKLTGKNFIYDDRVRGRVTIISPTPMPVDQAYAVFESVLQVKGFTTVKTPGGALKVIPLREAKETNIDTSSSTLPPPNRDTYITRLIPLRYIEAASIVNTLKPLVSKDAAIAAYPATNTVILTESASNIRRLISILENIDIETYREELAVLRVEYADATTLADQLSEIFGAEVSSATASPSRTRRARAGKPTPTPVGAPVGELARVRILTDERTNSLIVLAPRTQLEEVRRLVRKLDLPVTGGGRIHVYYLQYADSEELAQTLTSMISGVPAARGPKRTAGAPGAEAAGAQALRTSVTGLAEGISVTADPATNSLIIQASQEGFNTIAAVIQQLDVARPQVLVEALIMEVDISDNEDLGFNGLVRIAQGDSEFLVQLASDAATTALLGQPISAVDKQIPFLSNFVTGSGSTAIQGIIRAAAGKAGTNIISAPHILTSDNEEAEIRVGDNIPIVTSRVDAPTGGGIGLSTSVNVERQDIGVTLRVTPQITEGDTLRLDIFQEISAVNEALTLTTATATPDSGVALSKRQIENTVVVANGETVVIGGLIGEEYDDSVSKVPWLGDIPFLGWAFKSTSRKLTKKNLLVFLTPHIVRSKEDLEKETIRKREQFVASADKALDLTEREQAAERARMKEAEATGVPYAPGRGLNPVRHEVLRHEARYPLERMREIERHQAEEAAKHAAEAKQPKPAYFVQAGVFGNEKQAVQVLTSLVDMGYEGALVSGKRGGQILYEVRIGPYDTLDSAQSAMKVMEKSQGLAPSILVEKPETAPAPETSEAPKPPPERP